MKNCYFQIKLNNHLKYPFSESADYCSLGMWCEFFEIRFDKNVYFIIEMCKSEPSHCIWLIQTEVDSDIKWLTTKFK